MNHSPQNDPDFYAPDHRLNKAYDEATLLDEEGIEALCPSYIELSESEIRYRDQDLLGNGALKEVFRTYDSRTKRWIAMARLRTDRGPEFYDNFVQEAWLTSSLNHPNIIKIHDAGVDREGRPFFTMDLKGNRTLGDFVKESLASASDSRALLRIFIKVCDAVAYAHSRGVIHLDLKPENIQTDAFGEVLVCDWGLGKALDEVNESEAKSPSFQSGESLTLLGQIKGTPGFMAPEQAVPGTAKDHHADIFSLGCILHLILTGESPFPGPSAKAIEATKSANINPPRARFPHLNIPESLQAVIMKATCRIPEDRYHSAIEIQQEIQNYLGGFSTQAEDPGFFKETRLFLTRNRIPAAITSLALVALTTLSVLFVQKLGEQRAATTHESQRASQLALEADSVSILYEDELAQNAQQRKELAAKLASSAEAIKNLGIFERPVPTVQRANQLTTTALELDPDCSKAKFQRFSLNCLTLNLKDALAAPPDPEHQLADYLQFAKAFPNYRFTRKDRPSIDELAQFVRQAREFNPNRAAFMERVVSFDFGARRVGHRIDPSYHKVVSALLDYTNGGEDHVSTSYDSEESRYSIWSDQEQPLLVCPEGGSKKCVLRFIPIKALKLDFSGQFDLTDLNTLAVETLDLRGCENLTLTRPTSLPALRTIFVPSGTIDPKLLRNRIVSAERFEIVTEAGSLEE